MKLIYSVVILLFLNNCSFDNKTGIWNEQKIKKKIVAIRELRKNKNH